MTLFGWKYGRDDALAQQVIPVRFDPEFIRSLRTITYDDYMSRVVQTKELTDDEISMSLDDLGKRYPCHRVRRRVFA